MRSEQEAPGLLLPDHVEDDPVVFVTPPRLPDCGNAAAGPESVLERRLELHPLEVDHDPVGLAKRKEVVVDRRGEVEHDPGVGLGVEHAHPENRRAGRRSRCPDGNAGQDDEGERPRGARSMSPRRPRHSEGKTGRRTRKSGVVRDGTTVDHVVSAAASAGIHTGRNRRMTIRSRTGPDGGGRNCAGHNAPPANSCRSLDAPVLLTEDLLASPRGLNLPSNPGYSESDDLQPIIYISTC